MAPRSTGTSLSQNHSSARIRRGVAVKSSQVACISTWQPRAPLLAVVGIGRFRRAAPVRRCIPPQVHGLSAQDLLSDFLEIGMLYHVDVVGVRVGRVAVFEAVPGRFGAVEFRLEKGPSMVTPLRRTGIALRL